MRAWLDFAEGPMFRFCLLVMVLGLLRLIYISIRDLRRMAKRTPDKSADPWAMFWAGFRWISPRRWLEGHKAPYTATSLVFHIGLILVPVFYLHHVTLWEGGLGLGQGGLPHLMTALVADVLTVITIVAGLALVIMRLADRQSRGMSRLQDWLLTPLCVAIFVTGFLASHPASNPFAYNATRLVHVMSANFIFLLMPVTKLAHVVLLPFSHAMSDLAWKIVPGVGLKVRTALGTPDRPV